MKEQIKLAKKLSRELYALKPTKVKPSGKVYSRKKGKDSQSESFPFFFSF